MKRPILGSVIAGLVLAGGCTVGEIGGGSAREAALIVRTGEGCSLGCALDRPLLVGTREVAEVIGGVAIDRVSVRSEDPSVLAAWVEPVRLCCDDGYHGACREASTADAGCDGRESVQSRVVLRALHPGRTAVEISDAARVVAWEPVEIADAAEVVALDRVIDPDAYRDVAWVDGRLREITLRVGVRAHLQLLARDALGRPLQAARGITAAVDPQIARVGLPHLECEGAFAEGDLIAIEAIAAGATTLELRAGSASASIALTIRAACREATIVRSSDACETDADCVPSACCHPTSCVAAASAPACDDVVCSLECREATLDCGGSCLCLEGRCAAYLPRTLDPTCPDAEPPPAPTLPLPPPF